MAMEARAALPYGTRLQATSRTKASNWRTFRYADSGGIRKVDCEHAPR
jgi:hypothetical protein